VDVRISPGFAQKIVTQLKPGASQTIKEGPTCVENTFWWKIDQGWVPESVGGKYVLQLGE
jgi:hypothetical protein